MFLTEQSRANPHGQDDFIWTFIRRIYQRAVLTKVNCKATWSKSMGNKIWSGSSCWIRKRGCTWKNAAKYACDKCICQRTWSAGGLRVFSSTACRTVCLQASTHGLRRQNMFLGCVAWKDEPVQEPRASITCEGWWWLCVAVRCEPCNGHHPW